MEPTNRPTDLIIGGVPPVPGADPAGADAPPPVWSMPPAPLPVPPVVSTVPAAPKKRGRDPLTIVMVAAAFVALGGVGFAAGRVTAPASAAAAGGGRGAGGGGAFNFPGGGSFTPGGSFAPGGNGGLGRVTGGVSIKGKITEVTADHISLKLANGTTVTIPVDSNTTYHGQTSATSSDVTSGAEVQVQLSAGTGGGGGGQQPNASAAPGAAGRAIGPASDITIVSP